MTERLPKLQEDRGPVSMSRRITSLRGWASGRAAAGLLLSSLSLAGLSGCAGHAPGTASLSSPTTVSGVAAPSGRTYATVAAVRPASPASTQGSGAILSAMGISPNAGGSKESEVVVRMDDGRILSVLQADTAGLTPGTQVVIVPGATPRVVRPGLTAPAS